MATIISLIGIHNCKKTTTFNKLKKHFKDRDDILFLSEIPTALNSIGLGINNSDNKLSLLALRQGLSHMLSLQIERHLSMSQDYKYIIMDRCSLDVLLYTRYFNDIGDMIDDSPFDEMNIDIIKSYYKSNNFKIFYFGMDNWVDNQRIDSMSKESGIELENSYFNKFKDILIDYDNIDQIITEINNNKQNI